VGRHSDNGKKKGGIKKNTVIEGSSIIENRDENRYTNYLINQEGYYRKDLWNFVSFVPQKDCIKVFVLNGDYGFLSQVKLNEDDRYSYFKISNSLQLADAKDAIELSYFHFVGWVE
jgi:hypothetical protein